MQIKSPAITLLMFLQFLLLSLLGLSVQAETVLDNFDSTSYAGNNGTQNWVTDWIEVNESDGATNGDIQVVWNSGSYRLQIKDNDGGGEGVYREASLTGATAATLSFVYRRSGLDNANDYVKVEVSGDGGVSWTELDRFTGPGTDISYQTISYDITTYIASNTQIRFLSSPSLGRNDRVFFDNIQIDYTLPVTPHFSISHDGFGDSCAIESVTIAYHDGVHTVDTAYTGTITLSTSTGTGDWSLVSGSGTLTNSGSGAGTYVFSAADNGQVVLGLSNSTSASVNINITDGTYSEYGTEDADLVFSASASNTYADDFSVTSYSNSTGTLAWATDWLEINESDGANNGDIRITTDSGDRRLRLRDGNEGIQREFNISTATTATLAFDYRRDSLEASDTVTLSISSDGGSTWTTLDTFSGTATDASYQAASYDITAYKAANTRIRFMTSAGMTNGDHLYIDNVVITTSTASVCGSIDNFEIIVPAAASVCDGGNAEISIAAKYGSTTVTSYVGQVTLTVSNSRGDWAAVTAAGTLNNGTADDGAATYQFVVGDSGAVTLELGMAVTANVTVTVQDASAAVTTTSAAFDFVNGTQSLSITNDTVQVAGKPQSMTVTRLKNDCTVNTDYNATPDMAAWITRDVSDPAGAAPTINGVLIPDTDPGVNNLTGVNALTFVNGVASFNLDTTDIGKYTLNLKQNSRNGTSSTIITKPFGFNIDFSGLRLADFSDDGLINGTSGDTSYSNNETGTVFATAGQMFSTTITAMQWQASDDDNSDAISVANDGIPDGDAFLGDNVFTASFGGEGATVDLTSTVVAPATGSNGILYVNSIGAGNEAINISGFSSGERNLDLVWNEVGIMSVNANITGNNYWGSGIDVTGTVTNVGRFIPSHFALSAPSITNRSTLACGTTYTYMEEVFNANFTLTAQNTANNTTSNYTDVFAKLPLSDDSAVTKDLNFGAVNDPAGTPTELTSRLDVAGSPTGSWGNGIAVINYPVALFKSTDPPPPGKDDNADGPYSAFNIGIAPEDSDNVVMNTLDLDTDVTPGNDHALIGASEIRFGRIALSNAFGSELLDMNVPMVVQYYDGTGFTNAGASDICTTPATVTITDVSGTDALDATVDTCVHDTGNPGVSGSGCTTAAPASDQFQSPPDLVGSEGSFNLILQAPGAGKTGEADINVVIPAYMQYDWDGDNINDNNPAAARVTFGIYRGKSETIFLKEGR